jgi:hypothetical protein
MEIDPAEAALMAGRARAADKAWRQALEAAERAREARAVSVYRAHRAGASYRALGRALGLPAPNVVKIVRAGAEILERAEARG